MRLLVATRLRASCVFAQPPTNSPESVRALLRHPAHVGGSDAIYAGRGGGRPHPRGWGAFARFLAEHVRTLGDWTWHDAVTHLSARPAARFGLAGRGAVALGRSRTSRSSTPTACATRRRTRTRAARRRAWTTCWSRARASCATARSPTRARAARCVRAHRRRDPRPAAPVQHESPVPEEDPMTGTTPDAARPAPDRPWARDVVGPRTKGLRLPAETTVGDVLAGSPRVTDGAFSWPLLTLDDATLDHNVRTVARVCAERGSSTRRT